MIKLLTYIVLISYINTQIEFTFKVLVGKYNIILQHGTNYLLHYYELDMAAPYNWLSPYSLSLESASSLPSIGMGITNFRKQKSLHYIIYKDSIVLGNTGKTYENFQFYYFQNKTNYFDSIALAYKVKEGSLCLVHSLFFDSIIEHRRFAFIRSKFFEGSFYFGGFPSEFKQKHYNASCHILEDRSTWGCKLPTIYLGESQFENIWFSYFQTNINLIKAPKQFIEFLSDNYFEDKINKGVCQKITVFTEHYECKCREIKDFPDIRFIFGSIVFRFNKDKLFVQFDTICQLLIEQNTDGNHWIFGLPFVDEYGMEFDYEKKSITFYDTSPFEILKDKIQISKSSPKTIIIINIILLVILSTILSIEQYYVNKY